MVSMYAINTPPSCLIPMYLLIITLQLWPVYLANYSCDYAIIFLFENFRKHALENYSFTLDYLPWETSKPCLIPSYYSSLSYLAFD